MSRVKHQDPSPLTPELWAKVFTYLEDRPGTTRPAERLGDIWHNRKQQRKQTEVHQLKLVCKQFNDTHASHPRLVRTLYLVPGISVRSLPSVLAWLQQHKNSIQTLRSEGGSPLVDAVLGALVSPGSSLKRVGVSDISACALSSPTVFTTLEKCVFWQQETENLDLAPLGVLPNLRHLVLQAGSFNELHHLVALTRLECIHASVWGVHQLALTLRCLQLVGSDLNETYTPGLSTCTAVTKLVLEMSSLLDENMVEYLDSDMSVAPTDIELLRQLRTLHIVAGPNMDVVSNLHWSFRLLSLEDLSVHFFLGHGNVNMLKDASLLTNLTRLVINGDVQCPEMGAYDVDIEWHRLGALQVLSLCGLTLLGGQRVAGLLQLHHLQQVSFSHIRMCGRENNECFAQLIYNLRHCSQVKVHLEDFLNAPDTENMHIIIPPELKL